MTFTSGREPTNWEWFMDPVDHIVSSLIIDGLSDNVVAEVRDLCGYMGDNWVNWGILFGSFLTTSIASFDDDEREDMRNYVFDFTASAAGVDAALFDAFVAMEWMFGDPRTEVELKPLPLEEPILFFVAAFCMVAGVFRMVRLPIGVTPASTLVTVFKNSLEEISRKPLAP